MSSILIAAFESRSDAENLFRFLDRSGIESAVADLTVEKPGNAIPADFAKFQVRVAPAVEQEAIRATRQTAEGMNLISRAVRCPECGSCHVIYPHMPRNFLVPFFLRLMVKLRVLDGMYCCLSCRNEWSPPKQPRGGVPVPEPEPEPALQSK